MLHFDHFILDKKHVVRGCIKDWDDIELKTCEKIDDCRVCETDCRNSKSSGFKEEEGSELN